jgi:uncharacterized phage protein (TIGR01671 family)
MRTILFRGKLFSDGTWRYGFLKQNKGKAWIGSFAFDNYYFAEVDPETIGQYTGLDDKGGNKIFEGDVVSVKGMKRIGIYNTEIVFEGQGFKLKENKTYLIDFKERAAILNVIGNIHDNPELL